MTEPILRFPEQQLDALQLRLDDRHAHLPCCEHLRQDASVSDLGARVPPCNLSGQPATSKPGPLPESSLQSSIKSSRRVDLRQVGRPHQDEHFCALDLEPERALAPREPRSTPVAVTPEENQA